MPAWLHDLEQLGAVRALDRAFARVGRWRIGGVVWVLACVILWLPWRHAEGGIGFPQIAALLAFVLAHLLVVLFLLDLLLRQFFNLGRRRHAAVCAFELLFLLCVALAWLVPWLDEWGRLGN